MNYSIVKHKTNFKIDHSIIGSFDSSTLLPTPSPNSGPWTKH